MRCFVMCLVLSVVTGSSLGQDVTVGSKKFTENVILGDILTILAENSGHRSEHRAELGGTQILWGALLSGDVDAYPEYTGTIFEEIFAGSGLDMDDIADTLRSLGIGISAPLGFNNTYILGVTRETARQYDLESISDLVSHPRLKLGFSEEFMARGDGWPALKAKYRLPQDAIGLDHDIAYRGLDQGSVDVIDLYSTDAEIQLYNIASLVDDREFFPRYDAVILYRLDLLDHARGFVDQIRRLESSIDEATMIRMNALARIERQPSAQVATGFLQQLGVDIDETPTQASRAGRLVAHTSEHIVLVLISLFIAILVAIPLGIAATRNDKLGKVILGVVGALYTIPSLALLVFMIPLLGIGALPAIVALFLYSLLPVVRNTHSGITNISPDLTEAASAIGLSERSKLLKIQLPLASPSIMAGIKTAAVINIGTATLGALIGAGGLGQPILTGIRLNDTALILEGAIPAALLAFAAQGLIDFSERWIVPKGLRLGIGDRS